MNRRSFLGLPLAVALAKQVMGAEKPGETITAIEPIGETQWTHPTRCAVTGMDFDVIEFGRVGSPRHKFLRVYRERICLD